jgi:hypothetical protein
VQKVQFESVHSSSDCILSHLIPFHNGFYLNQHIEKRKTPFPQCFGWYDHQEDVISVCMYVKKINAIPIL